MRLGLLALSLTLSLSACAELEPTELDTAAADVDALLGDELDADVDAALDQLAILDRDELQDLAAELSADEEPPPPPSAATDCSQALYYGNLGATDLDQAASWAYKDYRVGGGGSTPYSAYTYLESAKVSGWKGYWALSRSGDEAGAESWWNAAIDSGWRGYVNAYYSCAAGRSYGCSAANSALKGLNNLYTAFDYLATASC